MSETQVTPRALRLGIDTSAGIAVGVAEGDQLLGTDWLGESRQHVEQLTPMITEVLRGAGVELGDLDAFIVGMGPGPFTGLRVGIASAQALAIATGVSIRGVCSLDAIAAAITEPPTEFCVVSDARRGEVYWAHYAEAGRRLDGPRVGPAAELPQVPVAGPGVAGSAELMARALPGGPERTDGGVLALAGPGLAEVGSEPLYLRPADATVSTRRKSTLAARSGRVRLRKRRES